MATATIIPLINDADYQFVPEARGYIINLVRGLSPALLKLEIERVARAGFNLILFPVYNNGWTLFPSESARALGMAAINPAFKKWDPLATATQLARQAGVAVWGFARPYNFHPRYSVAEHKLLRKFPKWRIQAHPGHESARTRRAELWNACPLNTDNRRYIGDLLTEMAAAYGIEGVLLDLTGLRLRSGSLAAAPYCFCEYCRGAYFDEFNSDMVTDAAGENIVRLREWQQEQMHNQILYLRHRLMRTRRTLRLLCRIEPEWRYDADYGRLLTRPHNLIDWPALLNTGAIEELLLDHDQEPCQSILSARLAADYAYLGDNALFLPMLKVDDVDELEGVTAILRRYPVTGFVAEFHRSLSDQEARHIAERYFAQPALLPETHPIRAAVVLLDRIRLRHEDEPVIHDLMSDLLRLLTRQMPMPDDFVTLEMIEENIHGLEQYIRRGRLPEIPIPEMTMRDLGLARRFIRVACLDVRS